MNAGFVGFDETENKRTILAADAIKNTAGIDGELNVLLRRPHGRAKNTLNKFLRVCNVKAYVSDDEDKTKSSKAGFQIEGGFDYFFEASDFVMIGTPGKQDAPYVEAGISHDCFVSVIDGAKMPAILDDLKKSSLEN